MNRPLVGARFQSMLRMGSEQVEWLGHPHLSAEGHAFDAWLVDVEGHLFVKITLTSGGKVITNHAPMANVVSVELAPEPEKENYDTPSRVNTRPEDWQSTEEWREKNKAAMKDLDGKVDRAAMDPDLVPSHPPKAPRTRKLSALPVRETVKDDAPPPRPKMIGDEDA